MEQIEERAALQPLSGKRARRGENAVLQRGQFTFYESFFRAVDGLPKSRQLEVYRAIAQYALYGTEPSLTGSAASVFSVVHAVLESGRSKAEARMNSIDK